MRSLIVGDGYLAGALAGQPCRSDVPIERMTCGSSDLDRLLGTQHFDQVVVAPESGGEHADGLIDQIDGPRWLICSRARSAVDSPSHLADEAVLRRDGTVFHLSTIFGRGGDNNFNRLVRLARRCRVTVGVVHRDRLVQPLHIDDLGALVDSHLRRPSSGFFEAAGPEALPFSELCQSITEILGIRSRGLRVPPRLARALDPRGGSRGPVEWCDESAPVDISPARAHFDWHPFPLGIRIEQGVHEAVA